jgi:hypothetical protein
LRRANERFAQRRGERNGAEEPMNIFAALAALAAPLREILSP